MTGILLALDTSTPAVVAGVLHRDGTVLAERIVVDAHAHAELLTPNVVAAVADAGLSMSDLGAVVVGCGPGPFTGLRVGMATAAAYGHALGIPVHPVCSLDAIGVFTEGEVLVVTDARRREVYWARYRDGIRIAGPGVEAPAGVETDGARQAAGSPAHAGLFGLPLTGPPHPTPAGLVAAADLGADPAPLVPLYLRRPDAKTLAERGLSAVDDAGRDAPRRSRAEGSAVDDAGRDAPRRSRAEGSAVDDAGRDAPRRSRAEGNPR